MTTPTIAEVAEIARQLSAMARLTIKDGDDREWHAATDRAAEQLEGEGLARRPFRHDRRVLVPTARGIAVRDYLSNPLQGTGE